MTSSREIPPDEKSRLQNLMREAFIPGMSIASIKNGKLDFAGTLGVSDVESQKQANDETIFWACSLSKPVFAYLVIKLIESGKLGDDFNLDSELWNTERFGERGERRPLTPRMILSHQSGLPNEGPPTFAFNPGEGYLYSGEGYLYLQKIIEERTHLSLEELAQQTVFIPLGMTNTTYLRPDAEKIAENHDEQMHHAQRLPTMIANDNNSAGSLHTTASDYARFLTACLKEEALNEMMTPEVSTLVDKDAADKKVNPEKLKLIDWGLGLGLQKPNQENQGMIAFHWGHGPGAKTFVAINRDTNSAVVYLTNSANGLGIAEDVVAPTVGDIHASMDYLSAKYGYQQHDSFEFKAAHPATEAKGIHSKTSELRLQWLDELTHAKTHPIKINKDKLKSYAGEYGPTFPMRITMQEDRTLQLELFGQKHQLIPISETTFASKNDLSIRLEFDKDKSQVTTHFLYRDKITQKLTVEQKQPNLNEKTKVTTNPSQTTESTSRRYKYDKRQVSSHFFPKNNKPIHPEDVQMTKSAFGQGSNLAKESAKSFRKK